MELRAGQNETAKWFPQVTDKQGQEAREEVEPRVFWCVRSAATRTDRAFRESVQGLSKSIVLASTNLSKLTDIENVMGKVLYKGTQYNIASVTRSLDGLVVYLALV